MIGGWQAFGRRLYVKAEKINKWSLKKNKKNTNKTKFIPLLNVD